MWYIAWYFYLPLWYQRHEIVVVFLDIYCHRWWLVYNIIIFKFLLCMYVSSLYYIPLALISLFSSIHGKKRFTVCPLLFFTSFWSGSCLHIPLFITLSHSFFLSYFFFTHVKRKCIMLSALWCTFLGKHFHFINQHEHEEKNYLITFFLCFVFIKFINNRYS